VLIVDEPTVGLDPRSVRLLKDLLRQQADRGATVFLSSHSLDVVEELADQMAIIDHGRLVAHGSLQELRAQAAHHGTLEEVFLKMTEEEAANPARVPPSPRDERQHSFRSHLAWSALCETALAASAQHLAAGAGRVVHAAVDHLPVQRPCLGLCLCRQL